MCAFNRQTKWKLQIFDLMTYGYRCWYSQWLSTDELLPSWKISKKEKKFKLKFWIKYFINCCFYQNITKHVNSLIHLQASMVIFIGNYNRYHTSRNPFKYVGKIFQKTNISNLLTHRRTCAYQGVRNVNFSKNFAYVLNEWLPNEMNILITMHIPTTKKIVRLFVLIISKDGRSSANDISV